MHEQNNIATTTVPLMRFGVAIPMRDGIHLSAILYLPENLAEPHPTIFTLTPYIGQAYHDQAVFFASHGYPFLLVDVRGRGNSEGSFRPLINEANDAFDAVEWIARQDYCNGQVSMWGGSYAGYDQWAAAKQLPPHLATIAPVAAPYVGVDFPIRSNLAAPYLMQWLIFVAGRAAQDAIFADQSFWKQQLYRWYRSGMPFKELDRFLGMPSETFQEWISHPAQCPYWDSYNPTAEQYAKISMPVLTITGIYDADQPGALMHYAQHLQHNPRACHYLIIGPWDHAGTRTPKREFCGLKVGPESLIDLQNLHLQWYEWSMLGGPKPQFLRNNVAYYVMGADKWRYVDALEAATADSQPLFLASTTNPTDVFNSGSLATRPPESSEPDHYRYDPLDLSLADYELSVDPGSRIDQRMIHASFGKQLIYHSAPFQSDVELAGFFRLDVWLAIDQPDTDIRVAVYEIDITGASVLLAADSVRARYREGLREDRPIQTRAPLLYKFERFTFVARQVSQGSRLRLVIGPVNSIYGQRNYNAGGVVSEESMHDARVVTVKLFHDSSHPSTLHVPFGQTST